MRYIYNNDTYEKEPGELLLALIIRGVLAALAAVVLETVGQVILNLSPISGDSAAYYIVLAFFVVAVVEEGTKLFFLHRRTWNDPNFDYRFDGIVYSTFVSLGFAAFENIKYVFSYGLSVAIPRALLAIPGHLGFAVVMGYFYGRARIAENHGNHDWAKRNIFMGYLCAVLMHGFYDSCAMIGNGISTVLFIIFIICMYIGVFRLVRKESQTNTRI
ncbi:MAG: PrsW family intramembrane metalloprotease [Lachnospiraceae bacterium]|nr:PrsW family intramembrane metalloprotease [Lachnospiraceae bacterium]